jgi:hypothetical protein
MEATRVDRGHLLQPLSLAGTLYVVQSDSANPRSFGGHRTPVFRDRRLLLGRASLPAVWASTHEPAPLKAFGSRFNLCLRVLNRLLRINRSQGSGQKP